MNQEQELKELYKQLGKIITIIIILWIVCIVLVYYTFTDSNIEILKTMNLDVINLMFLLPIAIMVIGVYFGFKKPGVII